MERLLRQAPTVRRELLLANTNSRSFRCSILASFRSFTHLGRGHRPSASALEYSTTDYNDTLISTKIHVLPANAADSSHGSITSSRNTLEEPYSSYQKPIIRRDEQINQKRHHGLPASCSLVKHVTGPVTQKSQKLHVPIPKKDDTAILSFLPTIQCPKPPRDGG